jgi:ABC-2 type transport system ATP-binding protein
MSTQTLSPTAPSPGPASATPVIDVHGLAKSYGDRTVLHGLTFSVYPREIFGILGSNGAGKTTAVEAIQGLRRTDGGQIRVLGRDPVRDRRELRALVGSQLQSSSLPDRLRVGEALRLFCRLAGDVVDWRDLEETWGLAARRETWRLIRRIREQGSTVVIVSHYMDEVEQLCDRVGVLHDGRIIACDTPAGLVASADGHVRTRFTVAGAELPGGLDQVPGVVDVSTHGSPDGSTEGSTDGSVAGRVVEVIGDRSTPVRVAAELVRAGVVPEDFTIVRPSLEDVFVTLTSAGRS